MMVEAYGFNNDRCQRIEITMCEDMKYNLTRMPNLVGDRTQREAENAILQFGPLVEVGCSKLLKFFLCSMHAPMCTEQVDVAMVIPPCQSMCIQVNARYFFETHNSVECHGYLSLYTKINSSEVHRAASTSPYDHLCIWSNQSHL